MLQPQFTLKEKIIQALSALPADMTSDEAIEQILLIDKIEKGLKAKAEGKTTSHSEAKDRVLNQWQQ
ncbi:MAG: hypothetical protein SFU91_06260 [Chloroherpetonaceae bacterium]|nr:hypothetical protein [Chloroherpetonaceae bacterium]